jgi:phage terminase large subunit
MEYAVGTDTAGIDAADPANGPITAAGDSPGSKREFIEADKLFRLFERQQIALSAMYQFKYLMYGGFRGGGKSYFERVAAIDYLIRMWQKTGQRRIRVGIFCETYNDLKDRQITKLESEMPLWLGQVKETKTDGLGFYLNQSFGSGLIALRNLDDISKYKSAEFAAIFVDQLEQNSVDTFNKLRGSLRWGGIDWNPFVGTANPGGIGNAWVKSFWIDRVYPDYITPDVQRQFFFVESKPGDNPHLNQSYYDDLNSQPEYLRRAWLLGDWSVFEGAAFPAWRPGFHTKDHIEVPEHFPRWRCVDYGTNAPFCCLWLAKNPDTGQIIVYREAYYRGLTDQQQAKLIREMSPSSEYISHTLADPSMFNQRSNGMTFTSSADEYAIQGIPLLRGDNDRKQGKIKVDRALMPMANGEPGLVVDRSAAPNLCRTLPTLIYHKGTEEVDTEGEDHPYDALKYGLTYYLNVESMNRQAPVEAKSPFEELSWTGR